MTDETKRAKLIQAINETERDLEKVEKVYSGTLRCIKTDDEEGFRVSET